MKANVNVIIYFFQLLFVCKCHYIQKCCDRRKQLTLNFDTCVDFDGNRGIEKYETGDNYDNDGVHLIKAGENVSHHVWWLPPDIKFVSSKIQSSGYKVEQIPFTELTDIKFVYNTMHPCPVSERDVVPFTDYVFILENGSLMIRNVEDNVRPKTIVFPYSSYCLDRVSLIGTNQRGKRSSHVLDHSFAILLCPCLYMPCVRMCCKWKHFLNFNQVPETCEYSANISLKWNLKYKDDMYEEKSKFPEQYSVIQNIPKCEHGEYHLNENSTSLKKFWILPNGNIEAEDHPIDIEFNDYCIHYWNSNGTFKTNVRICKTPEEKFEHILYGTFYSVGTFFLALTLLIYGVVKELRTNVHAYYLICHVFFMFISSLMMSIKEFFWLPFYPKFCVVVAYTIQFSFISATFWLNVMCIDICKTFRGYASSNKFNVSKSSYKTFIFHSMYVWGASLTITFITFVADNTSVLDKSCRPKIGIKNCWFFGQRAKFIYFYLPISLILIYNLYLFLRTSRKIFKLQKDSRKFFNQSNKHLGTNNVEKENPRMVLYAKLFGLMGLTWIFEILSWIIEGPSYYWYLTDAINSLRGLFIFVIFCCKKNTLLLFFNTCLSISNKVRQRGMTESRTSTKTNSTATTSVKTDSIPLELLDRRSSGNNELNLNCINNSDT